MSASVAMPLAYPSDCLRVNDRLVVTRPGPGEPAVQAEGPDVLQRNPREPVRLPRAVVGGPDPGQATRAVQLGPHHESGVAPAATVRAALAVPEGDPLRAVDQAPDFFPYLAVGGLPGVLALVDCPAEGGPRTSLVDVHGPQRHRNEHLSVYHRVGKDSGRAAPSPVPAFRVLAHRSILPHP